MPRFPPGDPPFDISETPDVVGYSSDGRTIYRDVTDDDLEDTPELAEDQFRDAFGKVVAAGALVIRADETVDLSEAAPVFIVREVRPSAVLIQRYESSDPPIAVEHSRVASI